MWVEPDRRDAVVDFVKKWSEKTELPLSFFTDRLGLARSKFFSWQRRYGCVNRHNGSIPREFWLEEWEKRAIVDFYLAHPLDGYRRCCYMMIDANIVAVSPATVYRVLKQAGVMRRWNGKPSKKGTGFIQPEAAHKHWHVDVSYVNIRGTFYYLCSVLDGYSRYIVHWDIRESMEERDVAIIIQRARERFPGARPRIISDNGPQFIAKEFKEFIRISGMTHVRTSPYYPQSNGKLERFHGTIKRECIRPKTPLSREDAERLIADYVQHYNEVRLHSAISYVTPKDKIEGRQEQVLALRDQRLAQARERRRRNHAKSRRARKHAGGYNPEEEPFTGQREMVFPLPHQTGKTPDWRSGQVEAGISAEGRSGASRPGVMPEVHLTGRSGRSIDSSRDERKIETAPPP